MLDAILGLASHSNDIRNRNPIEMALSYQIKIHLDQLEKLLKGALDYNYSTLHVDLNAFAFATENVKYCAILM